MSPSIQTGLTTSSIHHITGTRGNISYQIIYFGLLLIFCHYLAVIIKSEFSVEMSFVNITFAKRCIINIKLFYDSQQIQKQAFRQGFNIISLYFPVIQQYKPNL